MIYCYESSDKKSSELGFQYKRCIVTKRLDIFLEYVVNIFSSHSTLYTPMMIVNDVPSGLQNIFHHIASSLFNLI